MKTGIFVTFMLAVGLATSGCGQTAAPAARSATGATPSSAAGSASAPASVLATDSSAEQAATAPTRLTLSYSNLIIDDLPLWITLEAGIFRKNGLDVELKLVESSTGVAALTSGEVQMAAMGGSETMTASASGARFTVLATITPVYPYIFEAASSVQTVEDLRGKKVGVSRIGSSSDIATRVGLHRVGLDEKDMTIVQVGSAAARTAAMVNGAIQGALVQPPDNTALEKRGFHPLFDLAALKLPAVNTCLVTTQAYLAGHRDVVQKITDSVIEGIGRERADKPFALEVMKKYFKSTDTEALGGAYEFHVNEIVPALPYPRTENFQVAKDMLANVDPKLAAFDVNRMIDSSFVESAAVRGLAPRG